MAFRFLDEGAKRTISRGFIELPQALFTDDGLRYLVGAAAGKPFERLAFDLDRRTPPAAPLLQTAAGVGLLI